MTNWKSKARYAATFEDAEKQGDSRGSRGWAATTVYAHDSASARVAALKEVHGDWGLTTYKLTDLRQY